jgi:glyoxylase-like metal-dependent hydrolase (beta-lactamase superfamily II)
VREGFVMLTGAGGNVLVRTANAGQMLVDSGAAEFTDAVLARLRKLPGAGRVTTVFNTHWHREQVGGNLAFGRAGATIIAHEKTRTHLATDYYRFDEDRYEKALPPEARPTVTFFTGDKTLAGNERIEYGHLLEAHTDGDIYVFFRDANVLAAGDAISPLRDPELDWFGGGWLGGRVDAQEKLLKLSNAETRIVPSYGPVVGRAELQAEFDMTRMLFDRMLDLLKKGMSAQDMLDAGLMQGLNRTFRNPFRFAYDAYKGYWAHHNSLGPDVL